MLGGLSGIATAALTGDPVKGFAAAGAGARAGGKLGNKVARTAIERPSAAFNKVGQVARAGKTKSSNFSNAIKYRNDPETLKNKKLQMDNKNAKKDFMANKDNQNLFREKFGDNKYREMMKKSDKYIDAGVNDPDLMIKAMKSNYGNNDNQKVLLAKIASQIENKKDMSKIESKLGASGLKDDDIKAVQQEISKWKGYDLK